MINLLENMIPQFYSFRLATLQDLVWIYPWKFLKKVILSNIGSSKIETVILSSHWYKYRQYHNTSSDKFPDVNLQIFPKNKEDNGSRNKF